MTDHRQRQISEILAGLKEHATESLATYGPTAKGVGQKDERSHQLRFDKLAQVIDQPTSEEGITANDWGCGYGALFRYLDALPSVPIRRYYGYDISEEMLAAAQASPNPRAEYILSPVVTQMADYSFVAGTFNFKMESSDELWQGYIEETLLQIASKTRRGLAFNLLSTYVDWKQEDLFYGDPFYFFDFCKRNISRYVSLLHDYPLYEWTILVRKEEAMG
jgi:SAM-dependent methyltransferase